MGLHRYLRQRPVDDIVGVKEGKIGVQSAREATTIWSSRNHPSVCTRAAKRAISQLRTMLIVGSARSSARSFR